MNIIYATLASLAEAAALTIGFVIFALLSTLFAQYQLPGYMLDTIYFVKEMLSWGEIFIILYSLSLAIFFSNSSNAVSEIWKESKRFCWNLAISYLFVIILCIVLLLPELLPASSALFLPKDERKVFIMQNGIFFIAIIGFSRYYITDVLKHVLNGINTIRKGFHGGKQEQARPVTATSGRTLSNPVGNLHVQPRKLPFPFFNPIQNISQEAAAKKGSK